jgi:two-component system chemotaxis sensor kinase CheA
MAAPRAADHLAGRGVGLAAARRAVDELGGELRLASVPGEGFRAALLVPVRLTIQEAFVVDAGGSTFAVPVGNVREIRDAWNIPDDIDRPVPLAHALGMRGGDPEARTALIVEASGISGALLVSRVEDRREIVVRPLGAPLEGISPWAGATPLREGGLALVVDPVRLLRDAQRTPTRA